jgi:flagellar biogenesis protein FliO
MSARAAALRALVLAVSAALPAFAGSPAADAPPAVATLPVPAAATAAPPAWLRAPAKKQEPVAAKAGMSPVRVGLMLAVVAGIGASALYARRRRRSAVGPSGQPLRLEVLASTRLGPKAHAVVATVAGRRMLFGVTDHSVNVLLHLEADAHGDEPSVELGDGLPPPRAELEPPSSEPGGFLRVLRSAVRADLAAPPPAEALARATRDDVKLSRRALESAPVVEGQAAGILKRRRSPS